MSCDSAYATNFDTVPPTTSCACCVRFFPVSDTAHRVSYARSDRGLSADACIRLVHALSLNMHQQILEEETYDRV